MRARKQPEASVLALFQSASAWSRKTRRAVNANASSEQYGRETAGSSSGCEVRGQTGKWRMSGAWKSPPLELGFRLLRSGHFPVACAGV